MAQFGNLNPEEEELNNIAGKNFTKSRRSTKVAISINQVKNY